MVKARQTHSSSEPFENVRSLYCSRSTAPWGKPFNLWTSWVYPLRPRVPSWTRIRCMESATYRNTFMSPLTFDMSTATRDSAQTSRYLFPGQHFLETFIPLSYNSQDHTFMDGLVGRVFANAPGDLCSIPDRVIPKTLKMLLDTSLLNNQRYEVCIKGKVEQSWERSSNLPYTSA